MLMAVVSRAAGSAMEGVRAIVTLRLTNARIAICQKIGVVRANGKGRSMEKGAHRQRCAPDLAGQDGDQAFSSSPAAEPISSNSSAISNSAAASASAASSWIDLPEA